MSTIKKTLECYEAFGGGYFIKIDELAEACSRVFGMSRSVFYRAIDYLAEHGVVKELRLYEEKVCRDGKKRVFRNRLIKLDRDVLRLALDYSPSSFSVKRKLEWAKKAMVFQLFDVLQIIVNLLVGKYRIYVAHIDDMLTATIPRSFIFLKDLANIKSFEGRTVNFSEIDSEVVKEVLQNYLRWGLTHWNVCKRCFEAGIIAFFEKGFCPINPENHLISLPLKTITKNIERFEAMTMTTCLDT